MAPAATRDLVGDPPGEDWLRGRLERLAAIERPSASEGERRAAQWLAAELSGAGAREPRIEEEPEANGTYWWSLGMLASFGAVAGAAALRGGRPGRGAGPGTSAPPP